MTIIPNTITSLEIIALTYWSHSRTMLQAARAGESSAKQQRRRMALMRATHAAPASFKPRVLKTLQISQNLTAPRAVIFSGAFRRHPPHGGDAA